MSKRVLVVDDEQSICWGISKLCASMGLGCEIASTAEAGIGLISQLSFQAIVLDVRLPGMDGLSAIESFRAKHNHTPIIIMTAFGDLQTAITAIRRGAFDYVIKPFELDDMRDKIEQAVASFELATKAIESPAWSSNHQESLVGSSPIMQEVFKQIALTTTTNSPVLITGESGTGKELAARAIHNFSGRSDCPFVAVNIAALSPSLIESELFGHVKGAFTDSNSDRVGLIQQSNGGTLFLDEVAEIPIEIQVKLLRSLDLGEVIPVGSNTPEKTDFRLITATHQDLLSQINHGDFRHDLFYRIRAFEIQLPPLRQRKEDIPELVEHFLGLIQSEHTISASKEFVAQLQSRSWPGNVRELRNVVERSAILARGGVIMPSHLEDPLLDSASIGQHKNVSEEIQRLASDWTRQHWNEKPLTPLYEAFLKLIEKPIIATAYELSDRQYSAAARRLGMHRTTLKKKLEHPET